MHPHPGFVLIMPGQGQDNSFTHSLTHYQRNMDGLDSPHRWRRHGFSSPPSKCGSLTPSPSPHGHQPTKRPQVAAKFTSRTTVKSPPPLFGMSKDKDGGRMTRQAHERVFDFQAPPLHQRPAHFSHTYQIRRGTRCSLTVRQRGVDGLAFARYLRGA